jgi:hypothetical protein
MKVAQLQIPPDFFCCRRYKSPDEDSISTLHPLLEFYKVLDILDLK